MKSFYTIETRRDYKKVYYVETTLTIVENSSEASFLFTNIQIIIVYPRIRSLSFNTTYCVYPMLCTRVYFTFNGGDSRRVKHDG